MQLKTPDQIVVAVGALNQCPMGWNRNQANIIQAIQKAREAGAKLVLLPELATTGYGCEDWFSSEDVSSRAWEMIETLLPESRGMAVIVGLPVHYCRSVYNCAAMLVNGKLVGLVAKQNLAGDGVHYEPRWFKAWPAGKQAKIKSPIDGKMIPIGDLVFDLDGIIIGMEICEDAWVPDRPGRSLAERGVDIILNPSASHFAFGKRDIRRGFVMEASRSFSAAYLYTNLLGNESGRNVYDGHRMIATGGEMISESRFFGFGTAEVTTAVVDVSKLRVSAARTASFSAEVEDDPNRIAVDNFDWKSQTAPGSPDKPAQWQSSSEIRFEEFSHAVALGAIDYMEKSRIHGFTVSLSGGADSIATSVLVADAVTMAVAELGVERFKARFSWINFPEDATSTTGIIKHLLFTAYQAAENSTDATLNSARRLAENIGATFRVCQIHELVAMYETMIGQFIGRKLEWRTDDITLQNIQARCRVPGIWGVANALGHLLLTTSNRSEADVGYATMDGDTAGGYNLIGGVSKQFIRNWLVWRQHNTPGGLSVAPGLPALSLVNGLPPSAELRPAENNQTDEDDLMPYPVLSLIEGLAIGQKLLPRTVYNRLKDKVRDPRLVEWVVKFYTLWARSQGKRERYAPCLHLDALNTDPRSWCRFPILNGGFREEIEEHLASLSAAS